MVRQFIENLVAAIHTVPIIYIPHFHFSYIDELLDSVLSGKSGKKYFSFGKEAILECFTNNAVCDFETKESDDATVPLDGILSEILQKRKHSYSYKHLLKCMKGECMMIARPLYLFRIIQYHPFRLR